MARELFIGIGLVIGLAVGLGIGFSISGTSESDSQILDVQSIEEMMLDDSSTMQEMIMSTMPDSDQMQMMEDMMKDMMNRMQDDSELKQSMMEHMDRMKSSKETMMGVDDTMMNPNMEKVISDLYNKDLNPRQMEYPNHLGFNDLHIEAINHIIPSTDDSVLDMVVHHQCKVYDDMTVSCLLFPTGMSDQDKPFGMEYVVGADAYAEFSEEEKTYWHYHKTELPKVNATLPDLTVDEATSLMPILNETYGKVIYFWQVGDEYPIGDPFIVKIKELYARNSSPMMMKQSQTMTMDSVDFSNIQVTQISETSATITGYTDQPVFCQVEYGVDGLFTNSASDGMDMMEMLHYKHEVIISDLEPNTTYNYKFKATADDQIFYSDTETLTTK